MKPWIKRAVLSVIGATVLVVGLSACGHHRYGAFGSHLTAEEYAAKRDKVVDKVARRLDLNADQKTRLSTLGDKLREQRIALVGETKEPRAEIKALVAGDKFDAARAQALINHKTTAVQTKSPEVVAALASFYDSLNPAQQQKVRDYMEGRGRWFRHG
jgi:periplasmic protein CpxP/Spy